jgi:NAD-dependent deacetylase
MKKITILTGAGISAESGLQTFRDSNGLWENYAIEDVATPEAWKKNPAFVQDFYNKRRKQVLEAQANRAHYFLKDLENEYDVTVITQNIDDLHERAGSKNIIHLHGNIRLAKSSGPNSEKKYYPIDGWELKMTDKCEDGFLLRPHVVWFGEEVPLLEKASQLCKTADLLIVIGTSLQVYPAAGLIYSCKKECKKIIVDPNLNESILNSSEFIYIQKSAVESIDFLKIEIKKAFQN